MEERVRAAVRLLPLPPEAFRSLRVEENDVIIKARHGQDASLTHEMDKVFTEGCSQGDVYDWVAPAVEDVAKKGVNATVMAYGQTGTGKTFTMLGAPAAPEAGQLPGDAGVIPRAAASLFEALATGSADGTIVRATAHCSYLQIYGDRVQDLLVPDPSKAPALQVREAPSNLGSKGAVFVRGLSEYQVASAADVLALVARGTKGRATRATRSNEHSSRSHAVLQLALEVESVEKGNDENNDPARWSQFAASDVPPSTAQTPGTAGTRTVVRRAKLSLVDLAGSEKWSDEVAASQQFARELRAINTSLSALGNCIAALADLATEAHRGGGHVPYRDSVLTRLLQDALGGGTRAVVIATASAAQDAYDETASTLAFAQRATRVTARLRVDEVIDDSRRLVKAKREIARLRKRLQAAEQRARTPSPSPVRRPGRPTKPDPFEAAAAAAVERAERAEARAQQCNNQISRRFSRLNYDLHTIATTPARRRGGTGSSLLDRASTAASSPRNDW